MRSGLRRKLFLVVFLGAFIPACIAIYVLVIWSGTVQNLQRALHGEEAAHAKLELAEYLQTLGQANEEITDSSEVQSFLHTLSIQQKTQQGALQKRIGEFLKRFPEITQWILLSKDGRTVFRATSLLLLARTIDNSVDGFTYDVDAGSVVVKRQVRSVGIVNKDESKILGEALFLIPIDKIKKHLPDLLAIHKLSPRLEIEQISIETAVKSAHTERLLITYIALLFAVLLLSVLLAIRIVKWRIVVPIEKLTQDVLSDIQVESLDKGGSELDFLQSAFRSYQAHAAGAQEELLKQTRLAAVSALTQMFAHDVRKPFSILKVGLELLENSSDPRETLEIAKRVFPEVKKSMFAVNGMIKDILEIGSQTSLRTEMSSIYRFSQTAIRDLLLLYPDLKINFKFDFRHTYRLNVDRLKIARVFYNILNNALQATPAGETIWIASRDEVYADRKMVRITIGNSGSSIPSAELEKLFSAFYSNNKPGGTGLGLAIVHKMISEHGGKIWCTSSREVGVEFHFVLPVWIPLTLDEPIELTGEAIAPKFKLDDSAIKLREVDSKKRVSALLAGSEPVRILIVDDEIVYAETLARHFMLAGEVKDKVELQIATRADDDLMNTAAGCALVFVDVDIEGSEKTGLEFVQELRKRHSKVFVCVHSNRISPNDERRAIEAGADLFVPKPMDGSQLWDVVERSLKKAQAQSRCAVIEDSPIIRLAWKQTLGERGTVFCASPAEWRSHLQQARCAKAPFDIVIVDYYFDNSEVTGVDLAKEIKLCWPTCAVVLCTEVKEGLETQENIDLVISKEPLHFENLRALLKARGRMV